jgi:hypothetical protein
MRKLLLTALAAGTIASFFACSSNNGTGGTTGTGGTGNTTGSTGGGTATSCPGDLAEAPGASFCEGSPAAINCAIVTPGDRTQVCGVALPTPPTTLSRSSMVAEYAGSGPPDLSCYQPAGYPTLGTSQMVTVSGVAKIFAHGCASTGLTVEIWTVKRTGGADDGTLETMVGSSITTPMDCTSSTTGVQVTNTNCTPVYECKYSYPNVPSETELVIKTYGTGWAPLYDYNNYIPTAAVTNGAWSHDVYALASDDYGAIAASAIGQPISPGNGAIAGEVHDCGNVRLIGATVDVNVHREEQVFYFTTDVDNPLPDSSESATTALSLYAALDIVPGPVAVGAIGLVNGQVTTVGFYKVRVFADSVTTLTFQGLRPYQITSSGSADGGSGDGG